MSILPPKKNKSKNNNGQGKRPLLSMYWMYGLIIMSLLALYYFQDGSQTKNVDWTQFEAAAQNGELSKIVVLPEQRTAEGILTEKAAKKYHFNTQNGVQGEMKLRFDFYILRQ